MNPTLYFLSFKVKTVACGHDFVLYLTQAGKIYSQGRNDKG
jgi:alpha-tubulin suppressor-like RCC1 family protein